MAVASNLYAERRLMALHPLVGLFPLLPLWPERGDCGCPKELWIQTFRLALNSSVSDDTLGPLNAVVIDLYQGPAFFFHEPPYSYFFFFVCVIAALLHFNPTKGDLKHLYSRLTKRSGKFQKFSWVKFQNAAETRYMSPSLKLLNAHVQLISVSILHCITCQTKKLETHKCLLILNRWALNVLFNDSLYLNSLRPHAVHKKTPAKGFFCVSTQVKQLSRRRNGHCMLLLRCLTFIWLMISPKN